MCSKIFYKTLAHVIMATEKSTVYLQAEPGELMVEEPRVLLAQPVRPGESRSLPLCLLRP